MSRIHYQRLIPQRFLSVHNHRSWPYVARALRICPNPAPSRSINLQSIIPSLLPTKTTVESIDPEASEVADEARSLPLDRDGRAISASIPQEADGAVTGSQSLITVAKSGGRRRIERKSASPTYYKTHVDIFFTDDRPFLSGDIWTTTPTHDIPSTKLFYHPGTTYKATFQSTSSPEEDHERLSHARQAVKDILSFAHVGYIYPGSSSCALFLVDGSSDGKKPANTSRSTALHDRLGSTIVTTPQSLGYKDPEFPQGEKRHLWFVDKGDSKTTSVQRILLRSLLTDPTLNDIRIRATSSRDYPATMFVFTRFSAESVIFASLVRTLLHHIHFTAVSRRLLAKVPSVACVTDQHALWQALIVGKASPRLRNLGSAVVRTALVLRFICMDQGSKPAQAKEVKANGMQEFALDYTHVGADATIGEAIHDVQPISATAQHSDILYQAAATTFLHGNWEHVYRMIKDVLLSLDWPPESPFDSIQKRLHLTATNPDMYLLESMIGHRFQNQSLLQHAADPALHGQLAWLGDRLLEVITREQLHNSNRDSKFLNIFKEYLVNETILGLLFLRLDQSKFNSEEFRPPENLGNIELTVRPILHAFERYPEILHLLTACVRHCTPMQVATSLNTIIQSSYWPSGDLAELKLPKVFSDIVEAILGAIFVDSHGNLGACKAFLKRLGWSDVAGLLMQRQSLNPPSSKKTIQELLNIPGGSYLGITNRSSNVMAEGQVRWQSTVFIADLCIASGGVYESKKLAEAKADEAAIARIQAEPQVLDRLRAAASIALKKYKGDSKLAAVSHHDRGRTENLHTRQVQDAYTGPRPTLRDVKQELQVLHSRVTNCASFSLGWRELRDHASIEISKIRQRIKTSAGNDIELHKLRFWEHREREFVRGYSLGKQQIAFEHMQIVKLLARAEPQQIRQILQDEDCKHMIPDHVAQLIYLAQGKSSTVKEERSLRTMSDTDVLNDKGARTSGRRRWGIRQERNSSDTTYVRDIAPAVRLPSQQRLVQTYRPVTKEIYAAEDFATQRQYQVQDEERVARPPVSLAELFPQISTQEYPDFTYQPPLSDERGLELLTSQTQDLEEHTFEDVMSGQPELLSDSGTESPMQVWTPPSFSDTNEAMSEGIQSVEQSLKQPRLFQQECDTENAQEEQGDLPSLLSNETTEPTKQSTTQQINTYLPMTKRRGPPEQFAVKHHDLRAKENGTFRLIELLKTFSKGDSTDPPSQQNLLDTDEPNATTTDMPQLPELQVDAPKRRPRIPRTTKKALKPKSVMVKDTESDEQAARMIDPTIAMPQPGQGEWSHVIDDTIPQDVQSNAGAASTSRSVSSQSEVEAQGEDVLRLPRTKKSESTHRQPFKNNGSRNILRKISSSIGAKKGWQQVPSGRSMRSGRLSLGSATQRQDKALDEVRSILRTAPMDSAPSNGKDSDSDARGADQT